MRALRASAGLAASLAGVQSYVLQGRELRALCSPRCAVACNFAFRLSNPRNTHPAKIGDATVYAVHPHFRGTAKLSVRGSRWETTVGSYGRKLRWEATVGNHGGKLRWEATVGTVGQVLRWESHERQTFRCGACSPAPPARPNWAARGRISRFGLNASRCAMRDARLKRKAFGAVED